MGGISQLSGERVVTCPAAVNGPLPLVIEYLGYSSSRGVPIGSVFAAAGYAHIVVDPRGQGWGHPTLTENCPDAHDGTGAPGLSLIHI